MSITKKSAKLDERIPPSKNTNQSDTCSYVLKTRAKQNNNVSWVIRRLSLLIIAVDNCAANQRKFTA